MTIIIAAFALMIMGLSLWGFAKPDGLVAYVRSMAGRGFLPMAVGSRLVLALLLWFSAESSRHPLVFKILAIIALFGAVFILFLGQERSLMLLDWFVKKGPNFQRVWLLAGMGFGAYLLWAVWRYLTFVA